MGSVEIDIANKNVFDSSIFKSTTKDGVTITNENGIITFNGTYTGTGDWNYIFNIPTLKGNYILSINQMGGSQTFIGRNGLRFSLWEKDFSNVWVSIENQEFNKTLSQRSYIKASLLFFEGASFNNLKINLQVERNTKATAYVQHQSQTAIMPIQQEMLEGDYISDVEHHEWEKIILTGNEYLWENARTLSNNVVYQFTNYSCTKSDNIPNQIFSNYFKSATGNSTWIENSLQYLCGIDDHFHIRFSVPISKYPTLEDFKTMLKSKYEAGNPVIVYYKLAKPVDLELTEEQKEVKKRKLYTYEDITNVSLSDELASCKLTYVQDVKKLLEQTQAIILNNASEEVTEE